MVPLPPLTDSVAVPSFKPLQLILVCDPASIGAAAPFTVTVVVKVHRLLSVMMTE